MYNEIIKQLRLKPKTWLITGVAGFIGSNLLETLLKNKQKVLGMDNFLTGHKKNLELVKSLVSPEEWQNFNFFEADIRDYAACNKICKNVNYVLHHAALGSVPRSIEDPLLSNSCNINGFVNMLKAALENKIHNFVYAASSSTYGDEPTLPKQEHIIGKPLSPYAVTKYVNELYADVFNTCYNFSSIGLRYFNVFGQRQDPYGAYAAVIPQWFSSLLKDKEVIINGDGLHTRDYCHVSNVVEANILAATAKPEALNQIYNIAVGQSTSLNELFVLLKNEVVRHKALLANVQPVYGPFRQGDIRHSVADISLAKKYLGYAPKIEVSQGLHLACDWYYHNL